MKPQCTAARDISEGLFRALESAVLAGEFDDFERCFRLPLNIDTFDGRKVIETTARLRERFDAVRNHFSTKNATDLVNHCTEAEYRDADTITANKTLRLLSGTLLIGHPKSAFSILERSGGTWRIALAQYAFAGDPGFNAALIGAKRDRNP